jgi:thiol oxidase
MGAISCMDHVKCRRVGIKGFPTLISLNFDKKRPGMEVARVVGTHTLQELKDYISKLQAEAKFNETGISEAPPTTAPAAVPGPGGPLETTTPPTKEPVPGEQVRKEIWEESTKPMTQVTRIQDAASAFIFGLKQGVFMGREVLEDVELDSLKAWLTLVAKTFPGSINRKVISALRDAVAPIALLDFDTFDKILSGWQQLSTQLFLAEEAKLNFSGDLQVPEWQRLSNLFVGQGVTYRACALYTCGQWNMFHMLTMNPSNEPRSDELIVSVIATMRRFMKHFFGCVQCRDHFLEYNNLEMVQKISAATNKPEAIKRWLWTMHNAVNTRIRHPLWPKPDICPTCGDEKTGWLDVEVDKWLGNTYEYREVAVPLVAVATEQAALRKEDDDAQPVAPQAKPDAKDVDVAPTHPPTEDPNAWKPKDADLGIDHPAQKAHQASLAPNADGNKALDLKAEHGDTLQGERAPQVSLFAWYILPVGAVGAYFIFVRSRKRSFRSVPHSARE